MGKSFIDRLFGGGKSEVDVDQYKEIDLEDYEDEIRDETPSSYIKIAELSGLDMMPELKKQVYDGNILMIDVSPAKKDKMTFDRAIKELKQVVIDVHGDVAMIKEDQVIVTPRGIRIDRQKLK